MNIINAALISFRERKKRLRLLQIPKFSVQEKIYEKWKYSDVSNDVGCENNGKVTFVEKIYFLIIIKIRSQPDLCIYNE